MAHNTYHNCLILQCYFHTRQEGCLLFFTDAQVKRHVEAQRELSSQVLTLALQHECCNKSQVSAMLHRPVMRKEDYKEAFHNFGFGFSPPENQLGMALEILQGVLRTVPTCNKNILALSSPEPELLLLNPEKTFQ